MHVVAARPLCLDRRSVPEEALAAERGILKEQAAKSGKPPAIIERMVTGRLHKVRHPLLASGHAESGILLSMIYCCGLQSCIEISQESMGASTFASILRIHGNSVQQRLTQQSDLHLRLQFYEDSCLLEQKFVMDETRKVGQVVADASRELSGQQQLHIAGFVRFQCGEGLEKEAASFAEEVAQTLQGTG